jgi:hypothetical protein
MEATKHRYKSTESKYKGGAKEMYVTDEGRGRPIEFL